MKSQLEQRELALKEENSQQRAKLVELQSNIGSTYIQFSLITIRKHSQ